MPSFMDMGVPPPGATIRPHLDAYGRMGYQYVDMNGNAIEGPKVVPGNTPNYLSPTSPESQSPTVATPTVNASDLTPTGTQKATFADMNPSHDTQAESRGVLDSQVSYDNFSDFSSAMKQGLGLFGAAVSPFGAVGLARNYAKNPENISLADSALSNTAMQASGLLGVSLQDSVKAFGVNPAVDLSNTARGSDFGGNFGPSSMPNSQSDPGAMSVSDMKSYADSMTSAAKASASVSKSAQDQASPNSGGGGFGNGENGPTSSQSFGDTGIGGNTGFGDHSSLGGPESEATTSSGGWGGYTSESPGTAGGGGGADGNNGAGSRVICTHFYKKGELSRHLWAADTRWTLENVSPHIQKGYQIWGVPYVRLMRKYKLAETIVRPLALHRANEIAYQLGMANKPDYIGKLGRFVLEGISWFAGWLPIEPISYKTLYVNGTLPKGLP